MGGSGLSGPAALAAAASSVVNIRPVFGSMVPIWATGVTGRGLGGSDACTTNMLARESVRLGGLEGRDGVVFGICGTSRGTVAAWKSLSKMSSPNSGGAGLIACQFPLPGP